MFSYLWYGYFMPHRGDVILQQRYKCNNIIIVQSIKAFAIQFMCDYILQSGYPVMGENN